MTRSLFAWLHTHQKSKAGKSSGRKPLFKRFYPALERLEIRWLPSNITLGLYNDTSGGAKITSQGWLSGTVSDPGYTIAGLTVTFTGGVTGSTTTDGSGNYLFIPTLSNGTYSNIVASFTDHVPSTVNSTPLTFTYDTTPPSVTLTAPANSVSGAFQVTVTASDDNALPNGTPVSLDVDLNNDGNFTDPGEPNYTTGTLTSNSALINVTPALANGVYPLQARLNDQASNQGTSPSVTTEVSPSPTIHAGLTITWYTSYAIAKGITSGPDGNLWYTNAGGATPTIVKMDTMGHATSYSLPSSTGHWPQYITVGPDGNLWFTQFNPVTYYASVGTITTGGSITEFNGTGLGILPAASQPQGIAAGADGNLWVTEWRNNKIAKISTGGTLLAEYTVPTAASEPFRIIPGLDGNLWFTEQTGNNIAKITTGGSITEYSLGAFSAPSGIAQGPDGNIWYTTTGSTPGIGYITLAGGSGGFYSDSPNYPVAISRGPYGVPLPEMFATLAA